MTVPCRILLVDDDHALTRTLTWVLTENGYEVVTLPSGDQLFDRLASGSFDLLLLDIAMPGQDGLTLLEQVKRDARYADLPVLMLSSLPPEEATVRALGLGAADFIAKPFRIRELLARVRARLRAGMDLNQARTAAQSQAEMLQIVNEITAALSPDELFQVLVRRVAQGLRISKCSILLDTPDLSEALVVAAFENPVLRDMRISLHRYPEIRQAFESGDAVLVAAVDSDPLYAAARMEWEDEGRQVPTTSAGVLPFRLEGGRAGVFFLRTAGADPVLNPQDMAFAGRVIDATLASIQKAFDLQHAMEEQEEFRQLAGTDPLTGLANRRVLNDRMGPEFARASAATPLSCLIIDVDDFKGTNDTYGHAMGDRILTQLAELFRREARPRDLPARFGGEEFVLLMPETDLATARLLAQRLVEKVNAEPFGPQDNPIRVTVSIGVASAPLHEITTGDALLARADENLMRAKAAGRNRYQA